ncbi:hypothetical protein [Streptomyces sp. NPDC049944]|uniref:hypothetical protein n=1 Tax=Streptomyces sp. NPDC049944 TaxID=3155657 RepID=UPI0034163409
MTTRSRTKLRFAPDRAARQAGLVRYENDDRWFKLVHSVLPLTNGDGAVLDVGEFGKEGERPTVTPPTAVANAPMFGGPTADTMRLRLAPTSTPRTGSTRYARPPAVTVSTGRPGASGHFRSGVS